MYEYRVSFPVHHSLFSYHVIDGGVFSVAVVYVFVVVLTPTAWSALGGAPRDVCPDDCHEQQQYTRQ